MTDERWKVLLSVEPPATETRTRAERARRQALARLDAERRPARARWVLGAAMAAVALMAALWPSHQPLVPQEPAVERAIPRQERTTVHFRLSDGTAVQWVFDDRFAL